MDEVVTAIVLAESPGVDIAARVNELAACAHTRQFRLAGGRIRIAYSGAEFSRLLATVCTRAVLVGDEVVSTGWLDVMRAYADVITPHRRWLRISAAGPTNTTAPEFAAWLHSKRDNSWAILAKDGYLYTPDDFAALVHDKKQR